MEILSRDLKDEQVVYACAYKEDNNYEYSHLKQMPIKGIILNTYKHDIRKPKYTNKVFCKLNKDSKPVVSSAVSLSARHYASTYEECVEIYNGLVEQRIRHLKTTIGKCEEDKIQC